MKIKFCIYFVNGGPSNTPVIETFSDLLLCHYFRNCHNRILFTIAKTILFLQRSSLFTGRQQMVFVIDIWIYVMIPTLYYISPSRQQRNIVTAIY